MAFDPNKINGDNNLDQQDSPWTVEADEMPRRHVDLQSPEYTAKFASAEIYAKKGKVNAVEVTAEGLANGQYENLDVHQSEDGGYVIDTYVMRENADGVRERVYETTKSLQPGQWILTNPAQVEGDYPNNYAVDGDKFTKRYEPTSRPGVYRARGMARIIKNETGTSVEVTPSWGGTQEGDADCYFVATYDPNNPDEISADRYLLDENDFATYGLAAEVLAEDA